MKLEGAKKQTLFLTGVNAIVRALGLTMRVVLSRLLGAEIMGVMELSQSVHMVCITPLTSGLPLAISRLTAKASIQDRSKALQAGLQLTRAVSLCVIPLLWFLSPNISHWMGDIRVMPSLWFTAPCILILGYSASYNGYCYGIERSSIPAISELIEQVFRIFITVMLVLSLRHLTVAWTAAVPTFATMLAEISGLWYVIRMTGKQDLAKQKNPQWRKAILKLSVPTTFTRLVQTLLRSATSVMIPLRLQTAGLSLAEATSQLGMFNGMVIPFLMLPLIFTSSLSMVLIPRITKSEDHFAKLYRLLAISIGTCFPIAAVCTGMLYWFSPVLANVVYRQAELNSLFRICAPLSILFALGHLTSSILSALGQQRRSMFASVAVSVSTLALTWIWTPKNQLTGVVHAQYAGQLISLALNGIIFFLWHRDRHHS